MPPFPAVISLLVFFLVILLKSVEGRKSQKRMTIATLKMRGIVRKRERDKDCV